MSIAKCHQVFILEMYLFYGDPFQGCKVNDYARYSDTQVLITINMSSSLFFIHCVLFFGILVYFDDSYYSFSNFSHRHLYSDLRNPVIFSIIDLHSAVEFVDYAYIVDALFAFFSLIMWFIYAVTVKKDFSLITSAFLLVIIQLLAYYGPLNSSMIRLLLPICRLCSYFVHKFFIMLFDSKTGISMDFLICFLIRYQSVELFRIVSCQFDEDAASPQESRQGSQVDVDQGEQLVAYILDWHRDLPDSNKNHCNSLIKLFLNLQNKISILYSKLSFHKIQVANAHVVVNFLVFLYVVSSIQPFVKILFNSEEQCIIIQIVFNSSQYRSLFSHQIILEFSLLIFLQVLNSETQFIKKLSCNVLNGLYKVAIHYLGDNYLSILVSLLDINILQSPLQSHQKQFFHAFVKHSLLAIINVNTSNLLILFVIVDYTRNSNMKHGLISSFCYILFASICLVIAFILVLLLFLFAYSRNFTYLWCLLLEYCIIFLSGLQVLLIFLIFFILSCKTSSSLLCKLFNHILTSILFLLCPIEFDFIRAIATFFNYPRRVHKLFIVLYEDDLIRFKILDWYLLHNDNANSSKY